MTRFVQLAWLSVAWTLGACSNGEPCAVAGVASACTCDDGAPGARVCGEDLLYADCNCSGVIALPSQVAPGEPVSGTGGAGGAGGVGGSGGAGGTPPMQDAGPEDPIDAGPDADTTPIDAGPGDTGAPAEPPYRNCAANTDCDPDAICIVTPGVPTNLSVCAPACVNQVDCPIPEGTYEANVVCVTGYCQLNCTPVLFAPLLTCPEGMTCIAAQLGNAFCHDDGM